jgi:carboxylesterase
LSIIRQAGGFVVSGAFDKSPLSIAGDDRAVLCLHGMTGTPFEVRPLAEAFGREGFTVEAPTLAGHGDSLAALARSTWADWLASAQTALDALAARAGGRPVALVGFSMGALLSLRLARMYPERIAAVVAMGTPLRLVRWKAAAIRAVNALPIPFSRMPDARVPKPNGSDISIPEMRYGNPGLQAFPIAALGQLVSLMDTVRGDLPGVRAPVLIAQGRHDHVVPAADAEELAATLGSSVIERLWLERSFHVVGLDVDAAELTREVTRFVGRFLPETRRARKE